MLPTLEKLRIACLALLLFGVGVTILVIRNLGGAPPQPPQSSTLPPSQSDSPSQLTDDNLQTIFSVPSSNLVKVAQKEANPFYTEHYVPPPEPAPQAEPQPKPPPEPEPKTKTVELIYRGFFETQNGNRKAYVLVNESLNRAVIGSNLIGAWEVRTIDAQKMVLTAPANDETTDRQSLEIPFNRKKTIEIPKSS